MGAIESHTIAGTTSSWEATDLTASQWRRLEERLSENERTILDGLRTRWLNAAGLLDAWVDPLVLEVDVSYERALAAVETAETAFREFVRRLRRRYGI